MNEVFSSALLGGLLAGFLAVLELFYARRRGPTWRATFWICLLFLVDAGAGFLAYLTLQQVFMGSVWISVFWLILLSGLVGPAILRAQLALIGSGQEEMTYGPARRFRLVQQRISERIDDAGAAAEGEWIVEVAEQLCVLGLVGVVDRCREYILGRETLNDGEKQEVLQYLDAVLQDPAPEEERLRAALQKMLRCGGKSQVKTLARQAKKMSH